MFRSHTFRHFMPIAAGAGALLLFSSTAAACHPLGAIHKNVIDDTTHSQEVTADTETSALEVHTGDNVTYVINITNLGGSTNADDMISTLITDDLPTGVSLVSAEPYNLGTVVHGSSVVRKVHVKVTAAAGTIIKNTACFTGDSTDHKLPQQGCDVAYIKVVEAPTPSPTPSTSPSHSPSVSPSPSTSPVGGSGSGGNTPAALPETGASLAATALGLGSMAIATVAYVRSRKRIAAPAGIAAKS
jgi:uncharacterized repeat protein (TIGR01451 family)